MLISMIFYDKWYFKYFKYEIKYARLKGIFPPTFSFSKHLQAINLSFVTITNHWTIRDTSGEGLAWMCKRFEIGGT